MFVNECKSYCIDDLEITPVLDENGLPDRDLNPGDYVRHFKGNVYHILGVARHTESEEPLVIYESVTSPQKSVWARPLDMFKSKVDKEKYPNVFQIWRLEKVTINEKHPLKLNVSLEMVYGRQSEELCGKALTNFWNKYYNSSEHVVLVRSVTNKEDMFQNNPKGVSHSISGMFSGVSLKPAEHIQDGIMLTFHIGKVGREVSVSVLYGDSIYILDDIPRLVIYDNKNKVYDIFDVVPKSEVTSV